jgi:hypothetical protein
MSNHETDAATLPSIAPDDESMSLDAYAQEAALPPYAAPAEPSYSFPLVQYAKGVLVVSERKPRKHTGFQIETEQNAELDALLDSQGVKVVRVRHRNGTEGDYWQLETLKGYLLCTAVPATYGPEEWKRTGIAYVWNEWRNTYMYGSQLQCIFFSQGLIQLGYTSPLVLTFSRTVTEHFINKVLRRQEAVLSAVSKALKHQNKPADLAFYSYGVELCKGEEVTTKGGGSYYAPAITMPPPNPIREFVDYIKAHQTPTEHLAIIEEFLPFLPQWAGTASMRLLQPPRDNGNFATPEPEQMEEPAE